MLISFEIAVSVNKNFVVSTNKVIEDYESWFSVDYSNITVTKYSFDLDIAKHKSGSIIDLKLKGEEEILILLILEENDTKIKCFTNSSYHSKWLSESFYEYLEYLDWPNENDKIYGILCKIDYPKLEIIEKHINDVRIIPDVIEINEDEWFFNDQKIR